MVHQLLAPLVLTFCTAMANPVVAQATKPNPLPANHKYKPPPRGQKQKIVSAAAAVDRGDVTAARRGLGKLLSNNPHPVIHRSATILLGQIDGAFKTRQAFWRDREVVDRVVLVPDERAFLEATGQWTTKQFWPVLIEDGWFTGMFVAAFSPGEILRWSGVADPAGNDVTGVLSQVINAHNRGIAATANTRPRPPGVVVLDMNNPLWAGGLALALGRRQPVMAMVVGNSIHHQLDAQAALTLNATIMEAAARQGLRGHTEWFGLTLAGEFPYRYGVVEDSQKESTQTPPRGSLRALDDLLGRLGTMGGLYPIRAAVVGRLTGDAVQSVYQAMCSLFLQPSRMLWVDTYAANPGAERRQYHMAPAVELIRDRVPCDLLSNEVLKVERFRAVTRPVNRYGMIWMNTSGESTAWTVPGKGRTDDFPIGAPTVMHVIHSHSLASAWNGATLAGRAIAGGAYWYFGAMDEPYLYAFNTPKGMVRKIMAGTPLAFAARKVTLSPGPVGAVPWRLMLVGDPLYALRETAASRVVSDPIEAAQAVAASEDDSLIVRLRDATLIDLETALPLAAQCLKHAETLAPDDLVRAVSVLYAKKRYGFLSAIPDGVAARHKMAAVMVRLSRLSRGN